MKSRFYYIIFILSFPTLLFAQKNADWRYLFDKFEQGEVVYKEGGKNKASFNYFLISGTLVFLSSDDAVMEFVNPSIVSYVNIEGRIFELINKDTFYEKIKINDDCNLYVRWLSKVVPKAKKGALGQNLSTQGTYQLNSSSYLYSDHFIRDGNFLDLQVKDEYDISPINTYYVKIDRKLKKVTSFDSLAKIFKGHEKEVKEYIKTQTFDFKKFEDVKKAVEYCSQFAK